MRTDSDIKLGIFVTHPTPYFAPMWRELSSLDGIRLTVFFLGDWGAKPVYDATWDESLRWDVPILEGYRYEVLGQGVRFDRRHQDGLNSPRSVLRQKELDCVLVHGYTSRVSRQVARAAGSQSIGSVIRGPFTSLRRPGGSKVRDLLRREALKRYLSQFSSACYVGRAAHRELRELGVPPHRLFWSPYSVDTSLFAKMARSTERGRARYQLGIGGEDFVLLVVGRLAEHKTPGIVLEALRQVGAGKRIVTIFAGSGVLREDLERRAAGISGLDVRFPGFVNQGDLGQYYGAADALVFPSPHESWGLVLNEALYFGLPSVVSTGVSAALDLVVHGSTGFTFSPGDVASLASHIRALRGDPDLRRRMGRAGQNLVAGYSTKASAEGIAEAVEFAVSECSTTSG